MTSGVVVLLVAVGLALAVGSWRLGTDGRFRGTRDVRAERTAAPSEARPDLPSGTLQQPAAAEVVRRAGHELGERATLLQFSSAFCAPCRTTRRVLADVAGRVEGVAHVEVDAELHLEATRELGVMRTPTTLVLDAEGREVSRASGAPTRDQVLAAVAGTLP